MLIAILLVAVVSLVAGVGIAFAVKDLRSQPSSSSPVRTYEPPAPSARPVRVVSRPVSPVTRGIRVPVDRRPLWQLRGWQRQGNRLTGAFRTPRGSYLGEIILHHQGPPTYYITNPPQGLLKGNHAACFRARGSGKYLVHFGVDNPEVDSGIVAIEKIVAESLQAGR